MKDKTTKNNKKAGHFFLKRFAIAFSVLFLISLSVAVPVTIALYRNENTVSLVVKDAKNKNVSSNELAENQTEE